jgi:hypothetical protein
MSDHCTDDGATRLAAKIQEFWRKKGFDVSVEMKPEGFVATMRSARTDVRSDMVNGMPRRIGISAAT